MTFTESHTVATYTVCTLELTQRPQFYISQTASSTASNVRFLCEYSIELR